MRATLRRPIRRGWVAVCSFLAIASIVPAQDFSVVHDFVGASGGGNPWAGLTELPSGQLVGTTQSGGAAGKGSIFVLTPDGSGGFAFDEVYAFPGGADGTKPSTRLLLASDGFLYGTTREDGTSFRGTAFRVDVTGTLTTLHSFTADEAEGTSSFIQAGSLLYATGFSGGAGNWGTIFRMDLAGAVTVLHEFDAGVGGGIPTGVVVGSDGAFYGATVLGGANSIGVVFRFEPPSDFAVIHDLVLEDGGSPSAALALAADGFIYGATQGGGANDLGTVFQVDESGNFAVVHDFAVGDGRQPGELVDGGDGYLYGANSIGSNANNGTVFRVAANGDFDVLHTFLDSEDGPPVGRPLRATDGRIYGPAFGNPFAPGEGGIYGVDADGSNFEMIFSFLPDAPSKPTAAFLLGADGAFYGTTSAGGPAGKGMVYRLELPDDLTVLHTFSGADGAFPSVLIEGEPGTLYGSTGAGGPPQLDDGVVFRIDSNGFSLLHTFDLSNDGSGPSGLALAPDQSLFGTTFYSSPGAGTLFHFDTLGAFEVTHDFMPEEGAGPAGPLVWPGDGFYGVTLGGGESGAGTLYQVDEGGAFSTVRSFAGFEGSPGSIRIGADGQFYGVGTTGTGIGYGGLFRLTLDGLARSIHSFDVVSGEGGYPTGTLVLGSDGNLYGVTQIGGAGSGGTVFRADPSGRVTTLHAFSGPDGYEPAGGLVQTPDGDLYGTTVLGGAYGGGTIFRLTPPPALAVWSLVPSSGPASGGTPLDVSGFGFAEGVSVTLGGVGSPATFETASLAHTTAPPLSPGTLNDLEMVNQDFVAGGAGSAWFADFLDVGQNHLFHHGIESIFRAGITAGCGGGSFCPNAPLTRAQMAVFLLKAKFGPGYVPSPAIGTIFADVPANAFGAAWIETLVSLGITAGCGGGNYCPNGIVTRAQMAVFLLKTLLRGDHQPPAATGDVFDDVPFDGFAAAWIEELYARGVTGGCSSVPLLYCPNAPTNRGSMAVFLMRTFGLF
ncbi:MAG: choice-of-anchor tandem repeat GloVer-containing protein [Thermoanaerobaculia bacterium]